MAPRIVDRAAKQAQILSAATVVFRLKGYERTRMQDVAKAAGVGKATLYEYFTDKSALFMAGVEAFMAQAAEEIVPPKAQTLQGQLLEWLAQTEAMMAEGESLFPLMVEFWRANMVGAQADVFRAKFRGMYAQFDAWIVGLIEAAKARGEVRQEVQSEWAAAALVGLVDGMALQHWFFARGDVAEVIAQQVELICRGMAPC